MHRSARLSYLGRESTNVPEIVDSVAVAVVEWVSVVAERAAGVAVAVKKIRSFFCWLAEFVRK